MTWRARDRLGLAYQSSNSPERAVRLYERCSAQLESALGHDHVQSIVGRSRLGRALLASCDLDRGLIICRQAVEDTETRFGRAHVATVENRALLAAVHLKRGETLVAINLLEQARADSRIAAVQSDRQTEEILRELKKARASVAQD